MANAVLINDTSDWYHWGCTATSQALRLNIQRFGYQLFSVPIQTIYQQEKVPGTLSDFDSIDYFQAYYKLYPQVVQAIAASDVVVVNGEGTLHGITRPVLSLLYLMYASKKFLGKQVHVVNHSVYPEVVRSPRASQPFDIYRGVYQALDYIAIREPISHQLALKMGLPAARSFDSLPLIVRDYYKPRPHEPGKPSVVVAGSVSFPQERIDDLVEVISSIGRRGFDVQVLIGAKQQIATDDVQFVERLRAASIDKADWNLIEATSLQEWLDTINRASLLVSGRFHHTIAASSLGVPVVICESNTLKNQALSALLDLDPPIDYADDDFLVKLSERVDRGLNKTRLNVSARLNEWCRLAEKNFDGLRALAGVAADEAPAVSAPAST